MTEGQASAWADQFVEEAQKGSARKPEIDLGTFAKFKETLKEAFSAYDSPGEALNQMRNLRMKKDNSVKEHIAKFKSVTPSNSSELYLTVDRHVQRFLVLFWDTQEC